uniref:Family with sequence similarity 169 member Ab n=1 Tax=Sinocyclocheilus grahami TaxID=75366 RepID=A0A672SD08_SINGR
MDFPVDVLVSGRHEDLESSAQSYMNKLLYSNPDNTQYFTLPSMRKIRISPANVGFVPLYGANLKHKVLALFDPEDQFTAVALFLADQWYAVEDVLRTSNPAREGLVKARSVGERTVLYVLNRIIYRTVEMGSNEVPFLCHGEDVFAKILWKNGEAVGFYSVKSKGSLCNSFVSQCYLLPVMDSIFVRKDHRGNGHGLQILEDFVDSFKDDELGVKYPLTPAMQKVCRQYLSTYPADVDLLWEVEGVGGPYQKVKVASKLGSMTLQCELLHWLFLGHICLCHYSNLTVFGLFFYNLFFSFYQYIALFITRTKQIHYLLCLKDDIVDTPEVSEVVEQIDQELVTEEKQDAKAEVSSPVEEEVQQEQEEEVAPAVEDVASTVKETEDTDRPPAVPEVPVIPANLVECVSSVQDSDAVEEPSAPELEALQEETSASPSAAGEEEVIIETEEPAVNQQDETASDEPLETEESQPTTEDSEKEEPEEEKLPEMDEKDEQKEEEDTATTEDDDDEGKSSDEVHDSPPGIRVLRGGRIKPVPPTPKRTSSRLSKAVVIQVVDEEFDEDGEEENLTSTEEEKGSTEEEEASEHNSGEEEGPPVIDRRVLRMKTKVIQSTPTKAKRRSKN